MEKDDIDEGNIVVSLKWHGMFQDGGDTLKNLINKDVVTPEIQESLLSAEHIGKAQMKVFVDKRPCEPPDGEHHLNLKAPIQKNNAKTCILHCIHSHVETIIVAVQYTDVLLLLLAHYDRMGCTRLYMKVGMYFPVHEIQMLLSIDLVDTPLAFHDITGCYSVSQFIGHGKKTSWAVFKQHHTDLVGLGKGSLTENIATSTDKFICKIYGVPEVDTCNKARVKLFCIGRTQKTLPTTSDAATFHIMRSHYKASVWNQAHSPYPDLPPVTEMGWMHLDGRLVPRLLSLPPITKACREITSCGCTSGYLSQRVQLQETWRQLS